MLEDSKKIIQKIKEDKRIDSSLKEETIHHIEELNEYLEQFARSLKEGLL